MTSHIYIKKCLKYIIIINNKYTFSFIILFFYPFIMISFPLYSYCQILFYLLSHSTFLLYHLIILSTYQQPYYYYFLLSISMLSSQTFHLYYLQISLKLNNILNSASLHIASQNQQTIDVFHITNPVYFPLCKYQLHFLLTIL